MKIITALLLASSLAAQSYGSPCGRLTVSSPSHSIGKPLTITAKGDEGAEPQPVLFLLGFTPTSQLAAMRGNTPCYLLVNPVYYVATTSAYGFATISPWNIPNDPQLVGLPIYVQAITMSVWVPRVQDWTAGLLVRVVR